jgi:hypothetical protein
MKLNLSALKCNYDPFPIINFEDPFPKQFYEDLIKEFPPVCLFSHKTSLGNKYSLSRTNNGQNFDSFLKSSLVWQNFAAYIESDLAIRDILKVLDQLGIDLGFNETKNMAWQEKILNSCNRFLGRISAAMSNRLVMGTSPITSKWEFSMLPANGGFLKPHTDAPTKILTLVFPIVDKDEWSVNWGGGTQIYKTIEDKNSFNRVNAQGEFEQMNTVKTYDFSPNQALLFVRTDNSWHGISPINGPEGVFRRSLTMNIEVTPGRSYVK